MIDLKKNSFLVFGAGAIGTYIGGSLALDGNRVVFIEQPGAVEELRARGLHLDLTISRNFVSEIHDDSVVFAKSIEEALSSGPFDLAVYALKSFDTSAAVQEIKPHAQNLPPVLCLSNGVENEPALAAALGADKVIAGTVTSSIGRSGVGSIVLERLRGIGAVEGHPLSLFVAEVFNAAGLNVRLLRRASDMKWSKMLTNLPANATAAILNMSATEVFSDPGLFHLEMCMLREALKVMRAHRIRVVDLPGVPVRALAVGTRLPELAAHPLMQKSVGGGRGGKMPSFHIDLYSGRGKSEVDWLNGAVARFGEKVGVPAPVNTLLNETLQALTNGSLPLGTYARQPDKLLQMIA